MARQLALDTETTGLNPKEGHCVIEIACVEILDRRITGKSYHQYINPERSIDEGAASVHGLTNAFLDDKPTFKEIMMDFLNYIEGAELIIHNAPFDLGFLNHELSRAKSKCIIEKSNVIIDTLPLAREMHPRQKNSLDALCKRYSVDNSRRDYHGALIDADLLAQVYLSMTGGQESFLLDTFKDSSRQQDQNAINSMIEKKIYNLCVVKAEEEELLLHEKQLTLLKQKQGKCLWLEEQ